MSTRTRVPERSRGRHDRFGSKSLLKLGRIVNIGSNSLSWEPIGWFTTARRRQASNGFTKALAYEVAPYNVNVNAIAPGPIQTSLLDTIPEEWLEKKMASIPLGRFGTVKEIAPNSGAACVRRRVVLHGCDARAAT
jgi:3-oxoacyl-[acyl-carrier protein] reductase